MCDVGDNDALLQPRLTYSALREVSCWKVVDSILLIWLCCSPLLRKIHIGIHKYNVNCAGKQINMLILTHVCAIVSGG